MYLHLLKEITVEQIMSLNSSVEIVYKMLISWPSFFFFFNFAWITKMLFFPISLQTTFSHFHL